MTIDLRKMGKTNRGFGRMDFTDRYNRECSIQKSSAAMDDYIWLGMNEEPDPHPVTHERLGARMHLSRKDVAKLIPLLQHFAETGELP